MIQFRFLVVFSLAVNQAFLYYVRNGLSIAFEAIQNELNIWTEAEEGYVLGSLYIGYVSSIWWAGIICDKFGSRYIIFSISFVNCILMLLMPTIVDLPVQCVVACRIIMGLFQGFLSPSTYSTIAKWIPYNERSRSCTFICIGFITGELIGLTSSAEIISYLGWVYAFYIPGIALGVALLMVLAFIYDSPKKHPWISEEEVFLIIENISKKPILDKKFNGPLKPPYLQILTSLPFWALGSAACADAMTYSVLFLLSPLFLIEVHHMDYGMVGFTLTGACSLIVVVGIPFSYLIDYLITSQRLSIGKARMLSNGLSASGGCLGYLFLAIIGSSSSLCSIFGLTVLTITAGGTFSGYQANAPDLSPNFAGTIFGITAAIANLSGVFMPVLQKHIKEWLGTEIAWTTIFGISSITNLFGFFMFTKFGSGEVQDWNHLSGR